MSQDTISAEFPFDSKFIEVKGSKMHYVTEGSGQPVLFIHGIPTSAYLWRNIIPSVASHHQAIALDLIGMGKSDKPDIAYTVFEHIEYVVGFIEALDLKNLTLVLHAWGSVIGFEVARRLEGRIKALAFIESHVRAPSERDQVALPVQQLTEVLCTDDGGYDAVMNGHYFVDSVLPSGVLRKLSDEEMDHYRAPFNKSGSCKPLYQYLQDLPLCEEDDCDVTQLIANYSDWLQKSQLPKLMLYAVPGFITPISTVQWAKEHLPELSMVDIGDALHYAQESNPTKIAQELNDWLLAL